MRLRGKELVKEKKFRQAFGIPASRTAWIMVAVCFMLGLLVVGQAAAEPMIINEDTGGSWSDDFTDGEGIETCENVVIADGHVGLLSIVNGTEWEKKGVAVENRGYYDFILAKNPNVMIDDGVYKMWYAGHNGICNRILYATSTDGVSWVKCPFNPVVDLGLPGDPDDTHVDVPTVIKDEGMYKMWYSGNDSICDRLMYATSFDGINWTKFGVVLSEEGVHPNTIIKDGEIYKMWYQNCIGDHFRINYATSTDGISWTRHGVVLDVGSPGELDDKHVSGAAVVKEDDGTYKMWYSGHDNETGYKIFYATGYNEMNWIKHGIVMEPGVVGEYEETQIYYPNVIKDDNGYYKMWYGSSSTGYYQGYDTSIMYAVSQPSITEIGNIVSIKVPLPPAQSWKDLIIDKTETGMDNSIQVSVLDVETNEIIEGFENLEETLIDISSIDNIAHPSIRLKATFTGDNISTSTLNEWKVTWINDLGAGSSTPAQPTIYDIPNGLMAILAIAIGIALLSLYFAGGTEVGKYKLIPFISPLYTRLKKEEVLDQETRSMIYLYIINHPGDHYNNIKLMLQLNNGALAYHLQTLEKQDYIRSTRDGMYKRFYPKGTKIPKKPVMGLSDIQKDIIELFKRKPGATQKEISEIMGVSQQVASYHLNLMMDSGLIIAERKGKTLRYYTNGHDFY